MYSQVYLVEDSDPGDAGDPDIEDKAEGDGCSQQQHTHTLDVKDTTDNTGGVDVVELDCRAKTCDQCSDLGSPCLDCKAKVSADGKCGSDREAALAASATEKAVAAERRKASRLEQRCQQAARSGTEFIADGAEDAIPLSAVAEYELTAVINHKGSTPHLGHYVADIKQVGLAAGWDGQWCDVGPLSGSDIKLQAAHV